MKTPSHFEDFDIADLLSKMIMSKFVYQLHQEVWWIFYDGIPIRALTAKETEYYRSLGHIR